jgi:tRNA(Ile)-lysidine synthase
MPGDTLVQRVRDTIRRHRMLAVGDTVVVAVSGGPDSTAMLHVLAELRGELGLTLHVAHFNHGLRPDAADDAGFVGEMSRSLDLSYHDGGGDARAHAERLGLSVEDAARRLRYEFLIGAAREVGAHAVATGHTLDDQAETVLMRVLRGSGLRGLGGIPPVRMQGGIRVVRPLLDATRSEIEAYLTRRRLSWREDPTNLDLAILRNRVRMVLLPMLEGYNPDVRKTLARLAGLVREEADVLEVLAAPRIARVLRSGPGSVQIARGPFRKLPAALQRRAILEAVRRVRGNAEAVSFVHLQRGSRLVSEGRAGGVAEFPGGIRVRVSRGRAEVRAEAAKAAVPAAGAAGKGAPAGPPEYRLDVPGSVVAPEFGIHLTALEMTASEIAGMQDARARSRGTGAQDIMVDHRQAGPWMLLRGPRPGDRFAPSGMGGRTKKLSDYLIDAKVPRHRRPFVPVLTAAAGEILWIVGMRSAESACIREDTRQAVRIVARKLWA